MAKAKPPGEFDYLLDELDDPDEDFTFDDFGFDPCRPPPVPWYRTTAAIVAIGAIGLAVIAILVSTVLLVSRNSRGQTNDVETTIATTPSSAPATTPPMIATVPPPPPAETPRPTDAESPSPAEPTASAPVVVAPPRHSEPTKPPEIGVTRTPVTRQPISVRPPPVPHF